MVKDRIGTLLLRRQLITADQLEQALVHQTATNRPFGQVLLGMDLGSQQEIEEWILSAVVTQYGFPRLPLDRLLVDRETLKLVPEAEARRHCLLPVHRAGSNMTVVMADPFNADALSYLETATQCTIQPLVSTSSEIHRTITELYRCNLSASDADVTDRFRFL